MPKRGNWGNWAVIDVPRKRKKCDSISCEYCTSYSVNEKVCKKMGGIDPHKEWKTCKKFYFKTKYDTIWYWNELAKLRGF